MSDLTERVDLILSRTPCLDELSIVVIWYRDGLMDLFCYYKLCSPGFGHIGEINEKLKPNFHSEEPWNTAIKFEQMTVLYVFGICYRNSFYLHHSSWL